VTAEFLSAIAACLSFLATCAAAYATWYGPQNAARLAEEMRKQTQDLEEKRRNRLWIFGTLMQERAHYFSPQAARALNLIDVAFFEAHDVRQAWARLLEALDPNNKATELETRDRLRVLLEKMSQELNFNGRLTVADFERIYYPNALAETHQIEMLQRQAIMRDLQGKNSPGANTAAPQGPFPPRPS